MKVKCINNGDRGNGGLCITVGKEYEVLEYIDTGRPTLRVMNDIGMKQLYYAERFEVVPEVEMVTIPKAQYDMMLNALVDTECPTKYIPAFATSAANKCRACWESAIKFFNNPDRAAVMQRIDEVETALKKARQELQELEDQG